MKIPQIQNKLESYLAVALGAGAAATSAEAAVSVTTYAGPGLGQPIQSVFSGVWRFENTGLDGAFESFGRPSFFRSSYSTVWTPATSFTAIDGAGMDSYLAFTDYVPALQFGAVNGSDNYGVVKFVATGQIGVAQFYIDASALSSSYLMKLSMAGPGESITIPAAVTVVADAPEPAGFLLGGVPALIGAGALLRRRVRPGSGLGLMALGAEGIRARRESAAAA